MLAYCIIAVAAGLVHFRLDVLDDGKMTGLLTLMVFIREYTLGQVMCHLMQFALPLIVGIVYVRRMSARLTQPVAVQ